MLQIVLQIIIFIIFIFILFFVLWERGEREESDIQGASYEDVLSSYGDLSAEHEKETLLRINLEGKVSRYYSLSEISSRASSIIQEERLYEFIVTNALQLIGYGRCFITTIGKQGDLVLRAVSGFTQKEEGVVVNKTPHIGDSVYQWVMNNRAPLAVKNFSLDKRIDSNGEEGSLMCVPLIRKDGVAENNGIMGFLEVRSPIQDAFKQDDLRLLVVMADLLMITFENIKLYHRTQELSIRDGLTHLYLHRHFQEHIEEEMKRASFYKLNLSLLMCDLDFFKLCNDTYGHTFGDAVLRDVSTILMSSVRNIDFVARYGGDEFSVVLPETPRGGAVVVAERIRKKIEEHIFLVENNEMHVTISIGVASYPDDGLATKDDLVGKADEALLKAKKIGKNQVC